MKYQIVSKNKTEVSSFRPILSAIKTPTDNLAKFCRELLKPLRSNDYIIRVSFSFAKEMLEIDASFFKTSFDKTSPMTNIPLTETLNLCVKSFYRNIFDVTAQNNLNYLKFVVVKEKKHLCDFSTTSRTMFFW